MNRNEVADILEHIAVLLDLKGENQFKIRAYENAARSVRAILDEIDVFIKNHKLSEIKGIGKALDEKITRLVTTGKLEYYEELKASIPPSLIEMTRIPNLGPKRIRQINKLLKISTIHDLEAACRNDIIAQLEGFGKKSQEKILEGIQAIKKYRDKYLFSIAEEEADRIFQELRKNKHIKRLSFAGSLRRKKETIGDIDLVASTSNNKHVMDAFVSLDEVTSVIAKGDTKSTIALASGIHADLRTVTDKQFPYALHHLTGSKEHNIAMRSRALKMGMKINEYGLFKGKKLIRVEDEKGSVWGERHSCPSSNNPDTVTSVNATNARVLRDLGLQFGSVVKWSELVELLRDRIPVLDDNMLGGANRQEDYEKGLASLLSG